MRLFNTATDYQPQVLLEFYVGLGLYTYVGYLITGECWKEEKGSLQPMSQSPARSHHISQPSTVILSNKQIDLSADML